MICHQYHRQPRAMHDAHHVPPEVESVSVELPPSNIPCSNHVKDDLEAISLQGLDDQVFFLKPASCKFQKKKEGSNSI
jgi:hypothetical protein